MIDLIHTLFVASSVSVVNLVVALRLIDWQDDPGERHPGRLYLAGYALGVLVCSVVLGLIWLSSKMWGLG